ncbi:capsular polysaccharide synthesis protein [Sporofaciens sp. JLR.KK001]|uniref:capsular polysaccharide synthesis protein n=1 Tax=Sporofaciens sp. JLR.KK001 TaxID=3112621 RepID=UPI002FF37DC5
MEVKPLFTLDSITALTSFMDTYESIYLYGAGYYLDVFLQEMRNLNKVYFQKIKSIFVSKAFGNNKKIPNIPILTYHPDLLKPDAGVLLTLGRRYTEKIYHLLQGTGAGIAEIDFNMFQKEAYCDVEKSIKPFIDTFPKKLSGLNTPLPQKEILAWTSWWQGEEQAPAMVRACLASQRRNLPEGVRQIIITEDNCKEYLSLPEHITEKVKDGRISLTTLSDIIRAALLYKYGGFWMDSTLYVCKKLGEEILDHPIYTRNLPETQYCADAMWSGWFLYAKPGNKLFAFLMESFFYYFSVHDRIRYYFMVDYIIAIACNTFPEVEKQLKAVPYNNEGAQELVKHLWEPYDEGQIKEYIKNTSVQKLTYKFEDREGWETDGTICGYLMHTRRE